MVSKKYIHKFYTHGKEKLIMIDRINIQKVKINKSETNNSKQSFKGIETPLLTGLRGLNNSPALGACAVDLCSMVIPRTAIEMKNRGQQAGIEAAFREGASCLIHACVGLVGLGAATLLSGKFNNQYGVKAQNIFANEQTINNLAHVWEKSAGQKEFFQSFAKNINGLNGAKWRGLSDKASESIVDNLVKLAEKSKQMSVSGADKKVLAGEIKDLKNIVLAQITKDTGAQASFRLNAIKDSTGKVLQKGVSSSLSELVDNAVVLSNSFATKSKTEVPKFAKALIKNKNAGTILGLGICAALCMSIQPLNRYMTKKRTGEDGFVGVENKKADTSKGFKFLKTALGIGFPAVAISSIGKLPELMSNVQFNSKIPTLNQFKFLYSLTIGSRFLAARDPNELRESVIKDTLGYTNWLILGGMVSKLVARGIGGKELINNPVAQEGKKGIGYAFKWLTKSSVKSFDEVLMPKAKDIAKNGKVLKFSEMYKLADKATKSKVAKIAGSQIAGYLYSGLVLGVGIAKLNIFITKKVQARKDAKEGMKEKIDKNPKVDTSYAKENLANSSSVFKEFN
ncbi:MAG: hypothetical protein E7Z90_04480 [Cyanobacteria bacterium SIG29]|nr:hypothetical protein [Cyanobacteria bacterium SIG29]